MYIIQVKELLEKVLPDLDRISKILMSGNIAITIRNRTLGVENIQSFVGSCTVHLGFDFLPK